MENLINIGLPLALAFIMFSLGIGLTLDDFSRVGRNLRPFLTGAAAQIVVVPIMAFATILAFGISGELAVGFMLLGLCPGGVSSNIIAKMANGDVALSVSLTAVISLLSILTVPLLATWSVAYFMGADAPDISVTSLALAMFLITTVPVAIGLFVRRRVPEFASRAEPTLARAAAILFLLIVIAAVAGNWRLFLDNLASLGPALIVMNIALMLIGLLLATIAGLTWRQRKTISIETGIQNATLGITMSALITTQTEGFSTMALPSAVYGVTMYLVALPLVAWMRGR